MRHTLKSLLEFAEDACRRAGQETLHYFQTNLKVQAKQDGSPVTAADLASEKILRRLIERHCPEHSILGEEFGETKKRSPWRWILDPIDGTRSFAQGVPLYGVLMGLEKEGRAVLGALYLPALKEILLAAQGLGCFWNGKKARVSRVATLENAVFIAGDVKALFDQGQGGLYQTLQNKARLTRAWGDCYGHALIATGRADVMLDPVLKIWDTTALKPIIEEAGGTFTDWEGRSTHKCARAIATNGRLFKDLLKFIKTSRGASH